MGRGMDVEACGKCVKWSLLFCDVLAMLGGVLVLALGAWTLSEKSFAAPLLRNNLFVSCAVILLAAGLVVVFVSVLGCVGAAREAKFALLVHAVLLVLVLVVLLAAGALGYVFRDQIAANLRPEMHLTLEHYDPTRAHDPVTVAWNSIQKKLKCCGMGIPTLETEPWKSWKTNKLVNPSTSDSLVPSSCCRAATNGSSPDCSTQNPADADKIYTADCFLATLAFVQGHAVTLGAIAVAVAALMIFGIVFSLSLFKLIQ